jgi:hypothetical protein
MTWTDSLTADRLSPHQRRRLWTMKTSTCAQTLKNVVFGSNRDSTPRQIYSPLDYQSWNDLGLPLGLRLVGCAMGWSLASNRKACVRALVGRSEICGGQCTNGTGFVRVIRFSSASIIQPVFHIHFHLINPAIRRTIGRSPVIINESSAFADTGERWTRKKATWRKYILVTAFSVVKIRWSLTVPIAPQRFPWNACTLSFYQELLRFQGMEVLNLADSRMFTATGRQAMCV